MKAISILSLVIILVCVLLWMMIHAHEPLPSPRVDVILTIYKMLYDVDKLLNLNNIPYCINGGTLLGAIRNKGLIPWDDDLDIEIIDNLNGEPEYEDRLWKLKEELYDLGYLLEPVDFGFKIYPIYAERVQGMYSGYPALDVFIMSLQTPPTMPSASMNSDSEEEQNQQNQIIYYKNPKAQRMFGKCYYTYKEVFPLKRYPFANYTVNGPNQPQPYLDRCYGTNWNDIAYRTSDHRTDHGLERHEIQLQDYGTKYYEYARPTYQWV